jgi:maleylpyruvate isomerase
VPAPEDLPRVVESHARLLSRLDGLTNPDVARASRLPGWTVGHLLTHLARNADGVRGLFEAAALGEVGDMYPGGKEQREQDIEAGAKRPAKTLRADLSDAIAALEGAWDEAGDEVWSNGSGRTTLGPASIAEILYRRWREVEVHHVDLGLGYEPADWPSGFVERELPRALAKLPDRLAPDDRAMFTAWLVDRGRPHALPPLASWD